MLVLTYKTRLKIPDEDTKKYLHDRFNFYAKIEHQLFNQLIKSSSPGIGSGIGHSDKLREIVSRKYKISGRKANSMVRKVKGRINALKELKAYELENLNIRRDSIVEAIADITVKLKALKSAAAKNELNEEELATLRYLKSKKHRLSQKLNKVSQRIENFDKHCKSLCFGTKKLFKAQFYLRENGYETHGEWLREWRKARSNSWYFVGASAETQGNQNCQYDIKTGTLTVRKDTDRREYLVIRDVRFKYGAENIARALENNRPLTCLIKCRKHRYYLHISIGILKPEPVSSENGTIGLDYNVKFIQQCNVTPDGNVNRFIRHNLPPKDNRALSDVHLRTAIKKIVADAKATKRSVSIERLNFQKKKSKTGKEVSKNKSCKKMINSFDYSRYMEFVSAECYKSGTKLEMVNPYKTTITGKAKYSKIKGINGHQAASLVIGRKGLGLKD